MNQLFKNNNFLQFLLVISVNLFFVISAFSQKPQLIIPNQNQLYYGIDNQLFIRKFDNKEYIIKSLDVEYVTIKHIQNNEYKIFVKYHPQHTASIVIGLKNENRIEWKDTVNFEIKRMIAPRVFIDSIEAPFNYEDDNIITSFPKKIKLFCSYGNNYLDELHNYKVNRFRLIFLSKEEGIFELNSQTDTLSYEHIEYIISKIQPNDILLFDGIYVNNKHNNSMLLKPLVLIYKKTSMYYEQFNCEYLIQGYIRNNEKLYNYNTNKKDLFYSISDTLIKDSIWKYSTIDNNTGEFDCKHIDSFSNNRLIKSYFLNYKRLSVIEYINDSLAEMHNYYENGILHQKGKVLMNSNFHNYTYDAFYLEKCDNDWCCSTSDFIQDTIYTDHLNDIESTTFPTGNWKIYDKNGTLIIDMNFTQKEIEESYLNKQKYYQIIPKGDCLIYDEKGQLIRKIEY